MTTNHGKYPHYLANEVLVPNSVKNNRKCQTIKSSDPNNYKQNHKRKLLSGASITGRPNNCFRIVKIRSFNLNIRRNRNKTNLRRAFLYGLYLSGIDLGDKLIETSSVDVGKKTVIFQFYLSVQGDFVTFNR